MTAQRYVLGCGTPVVLSHESADRRVFCPGGGINPDAELGSTERCPGGEQWCVTAETVSTVVYTSRRMP
jgi:hypothetical protein